MTPVVAALFILVAVQAAAIVLLLVRQARRAQVEQALRKSEARFRRIADQAPVMLWTARADSTLDYLNSTCVEFSGLPIELLMDHGWLDAVHPDDLERCVASYQPAIEARKPFLVEYRARRTDGAYRWLLATGIPRYGTDGGFVGYIGCDVDITERREAEDRIRESRAALEQSHREIQHLAGRLIEAQDAERARIARDLHDDVSQQLAGLSIALSGLKQKMDELRIEGGLQRDLRALHERTANLAESVRHLSHDLHPTVLRHVGLVAALTTYCGELERSHGAVIRCNANGDFSSIDPEAELCLYRIGQEALRNVIAHAGATHTFVQLLATGDGTELTIVDDGKGFDVGGSLGRGRGLGLVSITERARLAGGTVRITAEPRKGTSVCVRIPLVEQVQAEAGSLAGAAAERREHGST